jgi:hypothetical protein
LLFGLALPEANAFVNVAVAPTNQVVFVGSNAIFTATASVTAGEVVTGYSWQTSTNEAGPYYIIPGAITATLTLPSVQLTNTGFYFARVTYNSGGSNGLVSVSPAVTLVVPDQARIVAGPQSLIRSTGASASFSVTAAGSPPLTYKWRRNGVSLVEGGRITGTTTTNLVVDNLVLNDGGSYSVVVSNTYTSVTSAPALLSVYAPPYITVQPTNVAVIIGSNTSISMTVTGSPALSYQWRFAGSNLSNGPKYTGTTSSKLNIFGATTNEGGVYNLVISNIIGVVTSADVFLNILIPPTIDSPTNAVGQQGHFFSFTNTAAGSQPMTFGVDDLPEGLTNDPVAGVFSGVPEVSGDFLLTVYATNAAAVATGQIALTLITDVPGITSSLVVTGKQGVDFSYTIMASNDPVEFTATTLPTGLIFDPVTGLISGAPLVSGTFEITIGVTNKYGADSQVLTMFIDSSVPLVTSSLLVTGKQGVAFSYQITATNEPVAYGATTLPAGLNFDRTNGVISGAPIVSGAFAIIIGVTNQFGSDNQILTLSIATSVPQFRGPLTASGIENASGFNYAMVASDSPTAYGASGLPLGLTVNSTNGVISGTPLYGGTFTVPIWAINAWGTGSTNLLVTINHADVGSLMILDVVTNWSSPYLLDFTFSLRDDPDPATGNPLVYPPSQLVVHCFEQATNPIPNEAPLVLQSATKKQLKMFLALDYTYSMLAAPSPIDAPSAIDAMQDAAKLLINSEPPHALFAIIEFNADYMDPQFVTNSLTTANNYFIADKTVLAHAIDGIQDTYVQGNYAGTRCFDAIAAAIGQFGSNYAPDEQRYVVVMSDGNDDSSLLNTNPAPVDLLVAMAKTNNVRIFAVAFGDDINTNVLQRLTGGTLGHYYHAATTADLGLQFSKIVKEIDGRYSLRWATLRRVAQPFQPAFTVTLSNLTASWNTDLVYTNIKYTNTSEDPPVETNYVTNIITYPYNPALYAGDVRIGGLRLVPDAELGAQTIRLRATYVPRSVRQLRIKYRPNYPCTASLASNGTNDILSGWTLAETADTNGLRTLTITSPNPTNLLASIPYAAFGDLINFQFTHPDSLTATQAFSVFANDNTIYTNFQPAGQSFVLSNALSFITPYPPMPPHGTPIPWLNAHGFTTNYAAAELSDPNGNGLAVWQDYLAGLNPLDPTARFDVEHAIIPGQPPQLYFNTVGGRRYRVDTATEVGNWSVLLDNIEGTGGTLLFTDYRNLSGVSSVFYRVSVY